MINTKELKETESIESKVYKELNTTRVSILLEGDNLVWDVPDKEVFDLIDKLNEVAAPVID